MFGNSWRVGKIAGVEIRIDSSWAIIAVLITYSLFLQITLAFPQVERGPAVLLAIFASALFFGSVLTHEMAHAVVAKARGIPVKGITLFLFGGATHAKVESKGPADEFVISVVGPLTSFGLAAIFWSIGRLGEQALPDPVAGTFLYLGLINLLLAVFNLLPGFPLDGGRVLRSAVWRATGSLSRATRVASVAGQTVGYLMIALGAFMLFQGLLGGIWLGAIGWFLASAARASQQDMEVKRMLKGAEAEDVMQATLISIPFNLTLREAVDDYFMRYDHGAFPVADGERTIGLVTLRGVKKVPREEWETTRVRDVMAELGEQVNVSPETAMDLVLGKLQDGDHHRVLVVRDGEVVGIITASDVARWLQRWQELEPLR